jgi:putative toxin-antitoxin system antitoxin component (TIGR02293 family)
MTVQMNTSKQRVVRQPSATPLARPSIAADNAYAAGARAARADLSRALSARSPAQVWLGVRKRFGKGVVLGRISGFGDFYYLPAVERDTLVKAGVPSDFAVVIIESMGLTKERFYKVLNLSRSTFERKLEANAEMSTAESERVIGLSKLIGQVQAMVAESGNPEGFDAARWFAAWMAAPAPALGGRKPEELLETADGREAVSRLLSQMQSGAYA